MLIDTSFDFRTDTPSERDPDAHSPTLRCYHKVLWSKALPCGRILDLYDTGPRPYTLKHRSELGEFSLSSDSIIHTYSNWNKEMSHIVGFFSEVENEAFKAISYTIGGMLVFPSKKIDGKPTINGARGCHPRIADRFDLTLECIRRHYLGQSSPLAEVLARYRDFFALFENFRGYVEFFLLQDLVTDDCSAVKFLRPFYDFNSSPLPIDRQAYEEYRRLSIEFVKARNFRIDQYSASLREVG